MPESNAKVAEEFAEGKKKGSSNRMFIEGDTIYSYGHHFPIAKKVGAKQAEFNDDKYSQTTSTHQRLVKSALERHGYHLRKMKRLM